MKTGKTNFKKGELLGTLVIRIPIIFTHDTPLGDEEYVEHVLQEDIVEAAKKQGVNYLVTTIGGKPLALTAHNAKVSVE